MKREGPALEFLLRRLADTPGEFALFPASGASHLGALVFDLSRQMGEPCNAGELRELPSSPRQANWISLCAIGCWLLADERLQGLVGKQKLLFFMKESLQALSAERRAEQYILDPERREEFARMALADMELRPAGETEAQAQDRLQALSMTERRRVIAAAREAEKRARAIREALAKRAAEEAADKYTRE